MFKTLKIDDKDIAFAANAATPFRYKQVFKKDLLQIFGNETKANEEGAEAVTELAYIMAMQAEKADMSALTYEGFLTWLEGFSAMAFINAAEAIINLYMDSATGTATP